MTIQGIVTFLPVLRLRNDVRKSIARENNRQMMDQTEKDNSLIQMKEWHILQYIIETYLVIKSVLYICWQQLNISADHLLIFGERAMADFAHLTHTLCTSTNSLSIQRNISLPCAQRPAKCKGNVSCNVS